MDLWYIVMALNRTLLRVDLVIKHLPIEVALALQHLNVTSVGLLKIKLPLRLLYNLWCQNQIQHQGFVCQDLRPFDAVAGIGFILLVQEVSGYILAINIIQ